MPTWNLLADYYGKIPHNELITIAKVQLYLNLDTEPFSDYCKTRKTVNTRNISGMLLCCKEKVNQG